MVLWQLCTLEHLRTSSFGYPPPRHGLQLLFWFANDCVTSDSHITMKLQSHLQPEEGDFGFHVFGNVEELLPALSKAKKRKKQLVYFVVGNLNADRYAAAASLPPYVRENYNTFGGYDSNNTDRIIISYQRTSQQVEAVYVTEHDDADLGMFRHDGTFQVSAELIRALQNPQLDLSAFLTQMGYYGDVEVMAGSAQVDPLVLSMMQNDPVGFFTEAFSRQMQLDVEPFGCRPFPECDAAAGDRAAQCGALQRRNRKPKASRKARPSRQTQLPLPWEPCGRSYGWEPIESFYPGYYRDDKKGPGGGGISFWKMLLGIGALYVAFKCLRWWLSSSSKDEWNKTVLKIFPRKSPRYPGTHVMLDYVY
uniref:Uncharacterized protein n=1 Tax=Oryzias latipes TaxID=8090 RepID=A0A3P9MPN7_ORYLA